MANRELGGASFLLSLSYFFPHIHHLLTSFYFNTAAYEASSKHPSFIIGEGGQEVTHVGAGYRGVTRDGGVEGARRCPPG